MNYGEGRFEFFRQLAEGGAEHFSAKTQIQGQAKHKTFLIQQHNLFDNQNSYFTSGGAPGGQQLTDKPVIPHFQSQAGERDLVLAEILPQNQRQARLLGLSEQ